MICENFVQVFLTIIMTVKLHVWVAIYVYSYSYTCIRLHSGICLVLVDSCSNSAFK